MEWILVNGSIIIVPCSTLIKNMDVRKSNLVIYSIYDKLHLEIMLK